MTGFNVARILVLVFVLFGVGARLAAQPVPPEPSAKEQALALYEKGTALYGESKFAEAVVFFEKAFALAREPAIAYNIAKSYEKLGQYAQAIEFFEGYLKLQVEKTGLPAQDKADVEATVRSLRERMLPQNGKVEIVSDPPGANVYLKTREALVGQTPYTVELEPGTYSFWVQKEGFQEVSENVVVERGVPKQLKFQLIEVIPTGGVRFAVNVRGAQIFVDGKVIGLTPFNGTADLPVGRHQIVISKERYGETSRILDVVEGQTADVAADLFLRSTPASWRSYVGWTAVSLGVLGITGGALIKVFGDERNYFEDQGEFKDLQLYQQLSYGLGGGLMAIGTGLVIWEYARKAVDSGDLIVDRTAADRPPVLFSAGAGPGGVSVEALVRF